MASKRRKTEHIRVSSKAKRILEKGKGTIIDKVDKLLGIIDDVEATKPIKIFDKPQNNLLDCLICTTLRIADSSLTKTQIYIGVYDLASNHPKGNISWSDVYKDFFAYEEILSRGKALRVSIDNRLNNESRLLKSGMVKRLVGDDGGTRVTWTLDKKNYKLVEEWAYQVSNLIPTNTLVVPSITSIGTIQTAPADWTLQDAYRESNQAYWNGILQYHNEALEKGENPLVYGSRKLREKREEGQGFTFTIWGNKEEE